MGMVGILRRAAEPDLQRLLREPGLLASYLYAPSFAPPPRRPGFLARLLGRGPAAAPPPGPPLERTEGDEADLDKAWHGLHYLLTGTAWGGEEPACYLVQGGEEVRGVEGFGSARIIRPAGVRRFADFLGPITREELLEDYDPQEMRDLDIYPAIWEDDAGDAFEYLWENFRALRAFVATAAERGEGLVIHIG